MDTELAAQRAALVGVTKRDGDPRVRHRAHALLAVLDAATRAEASARVAVSVSQLRRWRRRFLAEGRDGLADRTRPGRPPKLDARARRLLTAALGSDPMRHGYPAATWTIADLTHLLSRWGWVVSPATVHRAVRALGFVHRRPRHDLRHRQDAEAVASAQHALAVLQKRGLITAAESACSTSTSASSTPIPTWRRAGSGADSPVGSPPPAPTGG